MDAKSLDRNKLTQASFCLESVTLSPVQKIRIRGLFTALGIPCPPNEQFTALIQHAEGLEPYAALQAERQAILDQRDLLAEPDPVRPLLNRLGAGS